MRLKPKHTSCRLDRPEVTCWARCRAVLKYCTSPSRQSSSRPPSTGCAGSKGMLVRPRALLTATHEAPALPCNLTSMFNQFNITCWLNPPSTSKSDFGAELHVAPCCCYSTFACASLHHASLRDTLKRGLQGAMPCLKLCYTLQSCFPSRLMCMSCRQIFLVSAVYLPHPGVLHLLW